MSKGERTFLTLVPSEFYSWFSRIRLLTFFLASIRKSVILKCKGSRVICEPVCRFCPLMMTSRLSVYLFLFAINQLVLTAEMVFPPRLIATGKHSDKMVHLSVYILSLQK